jgi:hypothetical protein
VGSIAAEEIAAAFSAPLLDAPERLRAFVANAIYELDGLETTFYFLAGGAIAEAFQRMQMWHKEFAHLGYRGWAETYFAEVQRKNQFTLPNTLSTVEHAYLDASRQRVHSLIEHSSNLASESRVP